MGKRPMTRSSARDATLELKNRLAETEETLHAIRQYLVDAFVVTRANGTQVVTLSDAEFPYRTMVENMSEGAVTLIPDGTIFYCNSRFGEMVQKDSERLIGVRFQDLIPPEQKDHFRSILAQVGQNSVRDECELQSAKGEKIPVQLSIYRLGNEDAGGISIIATDIKERIQNEEKIRSLVSELAIAEQEERRRISQILHDDLQQRLFAIKAHLSFFSSLTGKDKNSLETRDMLDQVQNWISDAITVTRNLSVDISPSVLRGEGLADAILWLVARMKEQYGLDVKLRADDPLNHLNDHLRILLFHTVRELLFNVVKHADVAQATVTLARFEDQGRITVSDNGKGFDTNVILNDPTISHGLLLLQDRLSLINGHIEIHSTPGKGTHITIEFPIEEHSS